MGLPQSVTWGQTLRRVSDAPLPVRGAPSGPALGLPLQLRGQQASGSGQCEA